MSRSPRRALGGPLALLAGVAAVVLGGLTARADDRMYEELGIGKLVISGVQDVFDNQTCFASAGEVYVCTVGGSPVKLTSTNGKCDPSPQIHGGFVVYVAATGGTLTKTIFLIDLAQSKIFPIVPPVGGPVLTLCQQPTIHSSLIVFSAVPAGETDTEIFTYSLTTKAFVRLTSNSVDDNNPATDGTVIAWEQESASKGFEIVRTTVGAALNAEVVISLNVGDDLHPRVDNGTIVWDGDDGNDLEIYAYYNGSVIVLTKNDYDDIYADVRGILVVWECRQKNDKTKICYVDLTDARLKVKKVSSNSSFNRHPRIGGRLVVCLQDVIVNNQLVKIGKLFRELRSIQLPSNNLPYQGFAYAYSLYASFPNSASSYYAAYLSYYAYVYAVLAEQEFELNGSVFAAFYTYRFAQSYYSYYAAAYAYYAYFDAPNDVAVSSINLNYYAFAYGYTDYGNK